MSAAKVRLAHPILFVAAGLLAATIGHSVELAFALVAVLGVGMLHGISDLSVVRRDRRAPFVAAYLLFAGVVLIWWRYAPPMALATFLAASIAHFSLDDETGPWTTTGWSAGLVIVGGPAVLHAHAIAELFSQLAIKPVAAALLSRSLAGAGLIGLLLWVAAMLERREASRPLRIYGLAAAMLAPPLIGFPIAFVLLHAGPELAQRMQLERASTLRRYIVAHWPIAFGAALVLTLAALSLADRIAPSLALLFAGVAALALPHMVLTPLWRRGGAPVARSPDMTLA